MSQTLTHSPVSDTLTLCLNNVVPYFVSTTKQAIFARPPPPFGAYLMQPTSRSPLWLHTLPFPFSSHQILH